MSELVVGVTLAGTSIVACWSMLHVGFARSWVEGCWWLLMLLSSIGAMVWVALDYLGR